VLPSTAASKTALGHFRSRSPEALGRAVGSVVLAVTTYAPIDIADGGPELVAAAARLHQAIGHTFGVAELPQLTLNGELVWSAWEQCQRPAVRAWAASNGVQIAELPASDG